MSQLDLGQAEFLFHSDGLTKAGLQVFQFSGREMDFLNGLALQI